MAQRIGIAICVVCSYYDITTEQLFSASHKWQYADARAVICYILHEKWSMSLTAVGTLLHRHHSSVKCAIRKIKTWIDNPKIFSKEIKIVDAIIESIDCMIEENNKKDTEHDTE